MVGGIIEGVEAIPGVLMGFYHASIVDELEGGVDGFAEVGFGDGGFDP